MPTCMQWCISTYSIIQIARTTTTPIFVHVGLNHHKPKRLEMKRKVTYVKLDGCCGIIPPIKYLFLGDMYARCRGAVFRVPGTPLVLNTSEHLFTRLTLISHHCQKILIWHLSAKPNKVLHSILDWHIYLRVGSTNAKPMGLHVVLVYLYFSNWTMSFFF
jgi:hypothetical protein